MFFLLKYATTSNLKFDSEAATSENELTINHLGFLSFEILFSVTNILNYEKYYGTVRHDANARHLNGLEIQNEREKLNCFLDQNNRKKGLVSKETVVPSWWESETR